MAVLCAIQLRPRSKQSLLSSSLQHTHEDVAQRGLQAVLEHLQQFMPNVPLSHGPLSDVRRGWTDRDGVHVNTSSARLDTPMHEYGHIVTALAEQHNPGLLDHARQQITGTRAHEEIQRTYPTSDSYSLRDQLTETLNQLVGQQATKAFAKREQRVQTVVGQVIQAAQDFLHQISQRVAPLDLRTASLAQVIDHLSQQLLLGPSRPDVDAAVLHELFKDVAVDERINVELPATANDWLTRISGQSIGQSSDNLARRAQEFLSKPSNQGDSFVMVDNATKQVRHIKYTSADPFQRKLDIIRELREENTHDVAELTSRVVDFYGMGDEDRQARAQHGQGANAADQLRDQQLHSAISRVFPEFLAGKGDKVIAYNAENAALLGRAYDPAFDNGSVVLHLYEREVNGQKVQRVKPASLTRGNLSESSADRPLLAGLYNPLENRTVGGSLSAWLQKTAAGLHLTGSVANLHKLQVTLLGMHLKQQGLDVEGLSIVKLLPGRTSENQVLTFSPTEHLAALKAMRTMPKVMEMLQAQRGTNTGAQTLLTVLEDNKLYEASDYGRDVLSQLESHLAGINETTHDQIQAAVGDFRAKLSAQSARTLLDQIEARQEYMVANMNPQDLLASSEYRMLAATVTGLYGVKDDLNPYKIVQGLQRQLQGFLSQTNPYFRFVFNRWDDLRKEVKLQYEQYKDLDRVVTERMMAATDGGVRRRIAGSEARYFDALRQEQTFSYYDHKTNTHETRKILLPRFIQPGSKEWVALKPEQRAYIEHKMASIAEFSKRQYAAANRSTGGYVMSQEDVNTWYEGSYFAQGWIPMARTSVTHQVYKGNFKEAGSNLFQNFLEENNAWELDENKSRHGLSQSFALQNGPVAGKFGNANVLRLLGLELDPHAVNPVTGEAEEGYRLLGDYENKQAELEGDLRKGLDLFAMNALKHDVMHGMENYLMTARILMRQKEDETGVFQRGSAISATDKANMSPDEHLVVDAYNKLLLHRNNQLTGEDARTAAKALKALGVVTRHAVLAGNLFTPIRSNFATFMGRLIPQALANLKGDNGIDGLDLPWALAALSNPRNYGKLYGLGMRLSVLRTDEHDLINEVEVSGRKKQVVGDVGEHFMAVEKFADNRIRLLLMLMQMKKNRSWEAYSYDDTKGEASRRLHYDEAKHRALVGDARVDAIREDQILNGQLKAGEHMSSGYTGTMLRAMDQVAEDVLGPYTESTASLMDTNPLLATFTQFRRFLTPRLQGGFGKARLDANRGNWVTGEDSKDHWVEGYEVGMWQSFLKLASNAAIQPAGGLLNPKSYLTAWKGQNSTEKRNNKLVVMNLLVASALFALAKGLHDDDDKKKKAGLLDSAMGEAFIINQVKDGYGVASGSAPSIALLGKLGTAAMDLVNGDLPKAQRFMGNIGAYKFYNQISDWVNPAPASGSGAKSK